MSFELEVEVTAPNRRSGGVAPPFVVALVALSFSVGFGVHAWTFRRAEPPPIAAHLAPDPQPAVALASVAPEPSPVDAPPVASRPRSPAPTEAPTVARPMPKPRIEASAKAQAAPAAKKRQPPPSAKVRGAPPQGS